MVDVFKNEIIPLLSNYDAILFDSSPNFNNLTKNSLVASGHLIAPISCAIGTYQALEQNLDILHRFKTEACLKWETYFLTPTLLENNNLSRQIQGTYCSNFSANITNTTIRSTTKGQEASASKLSIFEYMPKSNLADDYRNLFIEMWSKINKVEV